MSLFADIGRTIRQIMLVEDRLDRLGKRVEAIEVRQNDMRDRLIRVESILEVAMRAGERRIGD